MKTLKKTLIFTFLIILSAQVGWGQTQIYVHDFETAGGYTVSGASECSDGSYDYFERTDGSDIGATYLSPVGTFYFAAQDIDAATCPAGTLPASIFFNDINISGYTSLELRVYLAEDDASDGNEDWDDADYVHINYDIDNSGSFSNGIWIEGAGGTNATANIDGDYDGVGEGAVITQTFTQYTKSISVTGSLIDIQIDFNLDSGDEDIAIDHIEIYGTAISNYDTESNIILNSAFTEPSNIAYASYQSVDIANDGNDIEVAEFTIQDGGDDNTDSDNKSTTLTDISFSLSNSADIRRVAIYDGTTEVAEVAGATTITFSGISLVAPDEGTKDFLLLVSFNSTVTDNDQFQFTITSATADGINGSDFAAADAGGASSTIVSDENRIEVTASGLNYVVQPSTTGVNNCMSPDVAVEATDANGNIDLDFTENIRITSTGSLVGTPIDVAAVSGLATFSGANCITHDATGNNFTLNAERTNSLDWDKTSDPFDITNACATELIISEYIEGSSNNKYIELYNNTGSAINLADYELRQYNNGSSSVSYTLPLSGTLNDGATYVIENSSETLGVSADLSTSSNVMSFNGDDVIELYNTSTSSSVDIIGKIGEDPGTEWGTGNESTADNTIVRNSDITGGDINGTDAFDPATEWTGYAQDDVSHLGSHTMICVCNEPTTDASNITFPTRNSTSLDLSWTNGDGGNRIVVCRQGTDVSFIPTDGTTYSANADYSAGSEVGTVGEGNKVVYNGSGSSMTVTGLTPGTTYYFKIFEYGCFSPNEDYYTSGSPAESNETTLPENVNNFTLTCITNTTATLTWTIPSGGFDGILIGVRESTLPPSDPTCDGQWLTSANTVFSSATTYCDNSTDSRYVYNATGTSVSITGLTPGADYVFKAFTWNGSDWTNGTQTAQATEVKNVSNEDIFVENEMLTVSWVNPTTCYDEILVIVHKGGSVTGAPADGNDGSAYTADASEPFSGTDLGSGDYIVYKGTQTNFDATGLTNGTQYCFKIFTRKGTEWSSGVEVCGTPADITVFNPGELIIIGFDSNVGGGKDSIFLTSLVDIKPGTEFLYVNSRYEAGAPANVRTDEWHGGGDDPDADPGIFKIVYSSTASANIPAGSVISFSTTGYKADYINVNGTPNSDFSSLNIIGSANIHATSGDQIWLLQGNFTDQGTYYILDGNVLWGLTNNIDWVPIDQPVSDASDGTGRESRLNPDLECFNLSMPTGKGYSLYLNSSDHNNSKRNLLLAIMNSGNWSDGVGDAVMNFGTDFVGPTYDNDSIGKPFTITSGGSSDGTWIGGAFGYETDWFSCMNWEGLNVPDSNVNVTIPNTTNQPIIDHTSVKAPKFSYIAECNDIIIDNETLTVNGSALDTLFVHGNLTIQNSGTLDMNSGGTNDGLVYIAGNWTNDNATFDAGKGTIIFNGTNTQTITTSATSEIFNNLRLTNNNLTGVIINNNIIINDTLSQNNNLLNLNGNNIELKGVYENTNSFFEGDPSTNFIISADSDNGNIDSIYFKNDTTVYDFSIDRTGKRTVLMTDLDIQNDLTITAGSVTLTVGHNYDVDGTLINTPGTSEALILKSDASGTASLIQNSGAAPATVERYLSGNNWHYIFAPLSQIDTSVFTVTDWGDANPNVYWYDEPVADFWEGHTIYNPTGWTNVNSQYLLTDKGYINYFTADKIYTQTGGDLTDADKSFTLLYTDNGTGTEPNTGTDWDNFEGWNLLGNPYVSAIDWDNAGLDKTYIENYVYYYDDTQDKYLCYGGNPPWDNSGVSINGGTQYIPAGQGFMVKALSTGNGQQFSIPKTARTHTTHTFYKSNAKNAENTLKLKIEKGIYSDETLIRTFPAEYGMTDEHDLNYDAYKMFSYNESVPQIYSHTVDNSQFFAVNTMSDITSEKVIALGIYIGETGTHSIEMTENYFAGMHIWLEDKTENINTNLLNQSSYSFNQSAETNDNRFFLHFQKNTNPILNAVIPDQSVPVNQMYEYSLPDNLFSDNDFEDKLTLAVTLENGDALPSWLVFNKETGLFSGTPSELQTLSIKITATDVFGATVSDVYKLTVTGSSSLNNITEDLIQVYPNPSEEVINVVVPNKISSGEIILKDLTGKIISIKRIERGINRIYVNSLTEGIYMLEIRTGNNKINKKIIKK